MKVFVVPLKTLTPSQLSRFDGAILDLLRITNSSDHRKVAVASVEVCNTKVPLLLKLLIVYR